MADSILRLKVESQEYDAKLRRATEGLSRYVDQCRRVGGTLENVEKDTLDYVKAIGRMETTSRSATGKLSELKKSFTEFSMVYKQMSDTEKQSPFGRALASSLDTLKSRINETRTQLESVNRELSGSKFGQLGNIVDGIGQKMGINANITELLTSRTALMTGAIGASTTALVAATKAWTDYNDEIAKQQQITTVTTGLEGDDADRMTVAARALAKTYNVDFRNAIDAANILMTQFGKTGDESIQLLRDGMRGMIQGDGGKLLSMVQQYAPSFRDAGISASQLVAVIHNSEGGIFTDQNMNAIVMGIKNIRLMTNATSEALAKLGIDGQKMSRDMSNGSLTVFEALKQVAAQLKNCESGSKSAGEVMQQVFGRQGAMAGTNLAKAIEGLNTNLDETKRQTGDVGDAFDGLYEANQRLENALQQTFGYKGWEEMGLGIKTVLVTAMAEVLEKVNKINEAFKNAYGTSFFDTIFDAASKALGPLGNMLKVIRAINKEKNGDDNSSESQSNETFKYIKSGADRAEREKRYDSHLNDLNKRLSEIGKEKTRKNKDGSTSYYIDAPEVQQKQRRQLLDQRTQLILKRDELIRGDQTQPVSPLKPLGDTNKNKKPTAAVSRQERAIQKYDQAEKDYQQALAQAALELKAGTITKAEARKKELQAEESLWKSIGDAREIYDSDKLKDAQEKAAENVVTLGGDVNRLAEEQKNAEQSARELEQANKKLAEARRNLAEAEQSGNLKQIYQAREQVKTAQANVARLKQVVDVVPGTVKLPEIPKKVTQVINTKVGDVVTPDIASEIVQTISTELGDIVTPDIAEQLTQVINTKVGEVVTPDIASEIVQTISTELGDIVTPDIAEQLTQVINTKVGEVVTPDIASEIVQTISTELGDIVTPYIAEQITQVINTKVGEVALPDIASDIVQTISTELGDIVTPDIAEQITQVINTKVGEVALPDIPKEETLYVNVKATTDNVSAQIEKLKKDLGEMTVGSIDFNKTQTNLADAKTFQQVLNAKIKNGIAIDENQANDIMQKITLGVDIDDSEWQDIINEINEKLLDLNIEPIKIDFKTGEIDNDGKATEKSWKEAAQAVQSVGSALQSIEDPAAQVAGTIAQAIASIVLGYAQATAQAGKLEPLAWVAFAATGLATMLSTISSIHSATGYADGGIVKGNSYSGDNIPALINGGKGGFAGLNAGEIVLNKAAQGNLASQLQDAGMGGMHMTGEISGENIKIVLNRHLKRIGQGEIVTW